MRLLHDSVHGEIAGCLTVRTGGYGGGGPGDGDGTAYDRIAVMHGSDGGWGVQHLERWYYN
jgi:hypothetical protein